MQRLGLASAPLDGRLLMVGHAGFGGLSLYTPKTSHYTALEQAEVAELADAADSKSAAFTGVPVRVRASAPTEQKSRQETVGFFYCPAPRQSPDLIGENRLRATPTQEIRPSP